MRTCTVCETKMESGYIHEEMGTYYCSDKCLEKEIPGAADALVELDDDDFAESPLYWTQWERGTKVER